MVDGVRALMASDIATPVNIGSPEYVTVQQLVDTVAQAAEKRVQVRYVEGPVGVRSRNFSIARILATGWQPRFSLRDGIGRTYPWIEQQVREGREDRRSTPHGKRGPRVGVPGPR